MRISHIPGQFELENWVSEKVKNKNREHEATWVSDFVIHVFKKKESTVKTRSY